MVKSDLSTAFDGDATLPGYLPLILVGFEYAEVEVDVTLVGSHIQ